MLQIAFRKWSKLIEHFSGLLLLYQTSLIFFQKKLFSVILFKNPHHKSHKFLISSIIHLLIDGSQVICGTLEKKRQRFMHFLSNFICYWENIPRIVMNSFSNSTHARFCLLLLKCFHTLLLLLTVLHYNKDFIFQFYQNFAKYYLENYSWNIT